MHIYRVNIAFREKSSDNVILKRRVNLEFLWEANIYSIRGMIITGCFQDTPEQAGKMPFILTPGENGCHELTILQYKEDL